MLEAPFLIEPLRPSVQRFVWHLGPRARRLLAQQDVRNLQRFRGLLLLLRGCAGVADDRRFTLVDLELGTSFDNILASEQHPAERSPFCDIPPNSCSRH